MRIIDTLKGMFNKVKKPERTSLKWERLTHYEQKCTAEGRCPDCSSSLLEGPHGGSSINFKCASGTCGSRFNDMGPFGVERISDASPEMDPKMVTLEKEMKQALEDE